MNRLPGVKTALAAVLLLPLAAPLTAWAYDSGSTGTDGALDVTIDTTLPLPPDGVLNYTDINVAAGATLRFAPNAANTPVTLLASGNVNIAGIIDVSGGWGTPTGAAGDGNIGDDALPGTGGPGGFNGGEGGDVVSSGNHSGGFGLGPGGGPGGRIDHTGKSVGGGGGGYSTPGGSPAYHYTGQNVGGPAYGSETLLPLVGGSGGGGGAGGSQFRGSGGGGGGGALLIAATGTVDVTGSITANGAAAGSVAGVDHGAGGGGGSGGAIRIVATTLSGNGGIQAERGWYGATPHQDYRGGTGAYGRIRLEAENFQRTSATSPAFSFGTPAPAFVTGLPALRIASVGGVAAPAVPTGSADIVLPADTPNPVLVEVATTGVPVGNTVEVTVTPAHGEPTSTLTPALTGTIDAATASVAVNLPAGPSTLQAETTYTIVATLGDTLAPLAGGERVERVRLAAAMNGPGTITLITVSGKAYTHPAGKVPLMPAG